MRSRSITAHLATTALATMVLVAPLGARAEAPEPDTAAEVAPGPRVPTSLLGIRGGWIFYGVVKYPSSHASVVINGGPLVFGEWDFLISDFFHLGAFVQTSFIDTRNSDVSYAHIALGFHVKAEISLDEALFVRPVAKLGFHFAIPDDGDFNTVKGMHLGPSLEIGYRATETLNVVLSGGFFTQPVGDDGDRSVTIDPTTYFSIGIEIPQF